MDERSTPETPAPDGRPLDLGVPDSLPIAAHADDLTAAIRDHPVVIVAGETGSGKSTQLPKLCLAAGRGRDAMIAHTQPRRVAARTVAERIATEMGTTIGDAVGYSVRFDDRVTDGTRLRVMTDGILLNELQRDRRLSRYDTIIVDEAHERSLNIDFILGYLKRLLTQRDDLRVIVTSATIDTDRFAEHFADADGNPAPVFVVEGRTYPVEVRYRPVDDQVRGVLDAVDELCDEGPGDILVFLSGEREIHDTATALRNVTTTLREPMHQVEVLPLYARLSASEQHRIFRPHQGRRVVLATNIAETSITVPGVRYVIDAGTARMSRYSKRLKVQRLPIEPVSQASADQRAGRCGRVAPGVCIRLYEEDDYESRPEFTEPEILRTNLASVILQMTAIGLGDVDRFPFVEAPDRSSIRDGFLLLDELGALQPGRVGAPRRLTKVGKQLARLPIDPRLGRMVIEAERYGCVREVLVIAAALSIQDVRERPNDDAERAAELHRRFDVAGSDLLSIVQLWDYLRTEQRQRSGNQFRRMCREEYLHYLRAREWRDLYGQLRHVAGQLGIRPSLDEAHPDHVHRSVLAGLLSHIGLRDDDGREFRGARGARFTIGRGSVLAKRPPRWVMAAELTETNRLWARRVATIQPEWAEAIAGDLVTRSYGEPRWDPAAGRAVVDEQVTLYGLPIVAGRTIGLSRVDESLARTMFIRRALVAGEWDAEHGFLAHNQRFVERVGLLEARIRRADLIDDQMIEDFYDERLPGHITSTRHFDRWWRDARLEQPDLLDFTSAMLANRGGIALADYPDRWPSAGSSYRITYRFDQGAALDGATVEIPIASLNQFDDEGLDWGVAGYRSELVEALMRTLPKSIRRELIPMSDTVAAVAGRLGAPTGRFVDALAGAVTAVAGVAVRPGDFDHSRLPPHLRVHLVVVDDDGAVLDASDDIDALRDRLASSARSAIAAAAPIDERDDITTWDLGALDRVVEHQRDEGHTVRGYPALLDRGHSVSLRVVDNEALQQRAMRSGVRRLLLMAAAPTPGKVARQLPASSALGVAAGSIALDTLAADAIEAAVDAILDRFELPWNHGAFAKIEQAVRVDGVQLAVDALAVAADIVAGADRVERRLAALTADVWQPTVADARAHVARLTAPGFVRRTGTDRLVDVERYIRGIEYRLDHLAGDAHRDQRRMAEVRPLEREYASVLDAVPRVTDELRSIVWAIEELRIDTFAQPIGARGKVSAKRIRRALAAAGGEPGA